MLHHSGACIFFDLPRRGKIAQPQQVVQPCSADLDGVKPVHQLFHRQNVPETVRHFTVACVFIESDSACDVLFSAQAADHVSHDPAQLRPVGVGSSACVRIAGAAHDAVNSVKGGLRVNGAVQVFSRPGGQFRVVLRLPALLNLAVP